MFSKWLEGTNFSVDNKPTVNLPPLEYIYSLQDKGGKPPYSSDICKWVSASKNSHCHPRVHNIHWYSLILLFFSRRLSKAPLEPLWRKPATQKQKDSSQTSVLIGKVLTGDFYNLTHLGTFKHSAITLLPCHLGQNLHAMSSLRNTMPQQTTNSLALIHPIKLLLKLHKVNSQILTHGVVAKDIFVLNLSSSYLKVTFTSTSPKCNKTWVTGFSHANTSKPTINYKPNRNENY